MAPLTVHDRMEVAKESTGAAQYLSVYRLHQGVVVELMIAQSIDMLNEENANRQQNTVRATIKEYLYFWLVGGLKEGGGGMQSRYVASDDALPDRLPMCRGHHQGITNSMIT